MIGQPESIILHVGDATDKDEHFRDLNLDEVCWSEDTKAEIGEIGPYVLESAHITKLEKRLHEAETNNKNMSRMFLEMERQRDEAREMATHAVEAINMMALSYDVDTESYKPALELIEKWKEEG